MFQSSFSKHIKVATLVLTTLFISIQAAFSAPPSDPTGPHLDSAQALEMDAQAYATAMGISKREALRRLLLQPKIGELQLQLIQNEPESFAGLYIQNTPQYRVIVLFTRNGAKTIQQYIAGGPLEGIVDVKLAQASLATLETEQNRVMALTRRLKLPAHTGRNVADNVVEVYVRDTGQFTSAIKEVGETLSPSVRLVRANVELRNVADLYGGLRLETAGGVCTSGFSVKKSSTGKRGIATAGHCDPPIRYSGVELNMGGRINQGAYDVAWYKATGFTVRNVIFGGSGTRSITYARIRSLQTVGAGVCKYGITSHYSCGQVVDNAWDGVNVRTSYFVNGGDSGGPNFYGNEA